MRRTPHSCHIQPISIAFRFRLTWRSLPPSWSMIIISGIATEIYVTFPTAFAQRSNLTTHLIKGSGSPNSFIEYAHGSSPATHSAWQASSLVVPFKFRRRPLQLRTTSDLKEIVRPSVSAALNPTQFSVSGDSYSQDKLPTRIFGPSYGLIHDPIAEDVPTLGRESRPMLAEPRGGLKKFTLCCPITQLGLIEYVPFNTKLTPSLRRFLLRILVDTQRPCFVIATCYGM